MKNSIKIHETAFVTATYRASNEALSKDKYSSLWRSPKTDIWIEEFMKKVSREEPFVHCLRNRFFYETIKRLIEHEEIKVLINFGCGFSMYPFLFDEKLINIEIDKRELIDYKKEKIQNWIREGRLPDRRINYISKDFNLEKDKLADEIKSITKGRPSFVLLEGVIFFLSKASTYELVKLIGDVQVKGSYFGSVSFLNEIENTDCFRRLIEFSEEVVASSNKFEYLTLPTSYYETLPEYGLVEHEDYVSLSKKYHPEKAIANGHAILNEHMYLLKRK